MLRLPIKTVTFIVVAFLFYSCSNNPTSLKETSTSNSTVAYLASYGFTYTFKDAGIRYHQSKYITSENSGLNPLAANRNCIGLWEQYSLVNNSDGTISLRSFAKYNYSSADDFRYVIVSNDGNGPLIANATNNSSSYSRFYIEQYINNWYYVKCKGNGKYLETSGDTIRASQSSANPAVVYEIKDTYHNYIPPSSAQTKNDSTSWEWPGLIFWESNMGFFVHAHSIPSGTTLNFYIDGSTYSRSVSGSIHEKFTLTPTTTYCHDIKVTFSKKVTFDSLKYDYIVGVSK